MHKKNEFIYESFEFEIKELTQTTDIELEVTFNFSIIEKEIFKFKPKLKFQFKNLSEIYNIETDNFLVKAVFFLGMVEAISYWKATCAKKIRIKCGKLSANQVYWFKKLFYYGLGEFRHINKIETNLNDFVDFVCDEGRLFDTVNSPLPENELQKLKERNEVIVPIGGGKDSIVSIEALIKKGFNVIPFTINKNDSMQNCIRLANLDTTNSPQINIIRSIDKEIIRLNALGYYNGHTPFSAIVAFTSLIAAHIAKIPYIALSNEASANEATIVKAEEDIINHQYSKSIFFESDFRAFAERYLSHRTEYFSYLRNLSELQIAKQFSKLKKYHSSFRSCNVGSKNGVWCHSCSKCLFVYLMLINYLTKEELIDIFGSDMIADEGMTAILLELTGLTEKKPFECVGTVDETRAAIANFLEKNEAYGILKEYSKLTNSKDKDIAKYNEIMSSENIFNYIPDKFK